jgi:hypothetical protein
MRDARYDRLDKILGRLELLTRYDIRELTETEDLPERATRDLTFKVLVSHDDDAFYENEPRMLLSRICRIEGVEQLLEAREIDPKPYSSYPLKGDISSKIKEDARSNGYWIDSIRLYVEGWKNARAGELASFDSFLNSDRVVFRSWSSRLGYHPIADRRVYQDFYPDYVITRMGDEGWNTISQYQPIYSILRNGKLVHTEPRYLLKESATGPHHAQSRM